MTSKTIFFLLFLSLTQLNIFGQDTVLFRFKVQEYSHSSTSDTILYAGKDLEFSVVRIYLAQNIFIEKNLFSGNPDWQRGSSDTFKITSKKWLIKRKGKWEYFFSVQGFKKKAYSSITIAMNEYYLIPRRVITENGRFFYEFYSKPKNKSQSVSTEMIYIIDPKLGIYKILASDFTFLRCKI